jgi:serine/threonine-protein kinase
MGDDEKTTILGATPAGYGADGDWDDDETARRRRRNRVIAAVIGALVLLGAVVGVALLVNSDGDGDPAPQATAQVAVPALVGQLQSDAEAALQEAGLGVGEVTPQVTQDESAVGTVLESNPASGAQVDEGTRVDLTVGVAPDSVTVPQVVGLDVERAQTALENAGFTGNTNTDQTDSLEPEGTVTAVDPEEGSAVAADTTVTLAVSDGDAAVPDVTGQAQDAAQQALRAEGFTNLTVEEVDSDQPAGTVIATDPAAGQQATADAAITLQVSGGPAPIEVPDVEGDTQAEAQAQLTAAGFTNVTVTTAVAGDPGDVGLVLSVDPAAGTEVPADQLITLTVGTAPPDTGGDTGGEDGGVDGDPATPI